MAEIVGTITNLSDFLSKTQVCLSVKPNDPQQQIICLEADRKYSIPAFQREVRWDDNNLKMLLYDLSRSSKFLGNIILTIKSDHTCEIIDGQQRTTVLMLIVSCIKKKFGTKISTPDLCPLRNEGFTGFQTLLEKAFDQEAITSDDWNAILKSDDYHQLPRIQKLWNTISSSELLADRHKAQGLLDNLCKSEFNIIASYSNDVNTSIQYFLDVNLKGIRLDTEDIFKGYLFSQDSRELTRSLWQKNKRDVLRLNGVTQSSEEKRYPLMKLYEHFFYCDLYLPREGDCEYSTLKFGENFCLTSGFESGSTKYYEGSHLIEAIRDRDYLQNVLSRLNKCVEIMTDIIESEGPSTPFKDKFICAKKVDSIDIQNCHSMLKKILMEKEVIPKILALKYRCIGERERTAILKRADQYLGSDQQSVLNAVKSSLMDSVYDERLKKAFEELEELRAQANRLDTRLKTNEEKLIKAGGEKARELQERIEELIRLISIARDELERIESKDENDASLTEENNLHKADQKFKYYEQEIAKATRTNTALRKKELVDSLVNEIKLQATTALKQEIVRKTNEKLRRVIVDDYVEIESIDRYIKLKGRDGASEGQTLSIAYCFLGTLFEDSELEFPFIIDSPTGKMDFEKRQAVADIIPLVFNQMIAFVQSAEVERFADRFYANPDSQYLTVVASPQDQAVVVYEGIDFFDSYQREHKGDEK